MGNTCANSQVENNESVVRTQYSQKLHLPLVQDQKLREILGDDNQTVGEISTDRLESKALDNKESQSQRISQGRRKLLPKRYYEDTMTLNKSQNLVYSVQEEIIQNLDELGAEQKSDILDKQPYEEELDYDLQYEINYDNLRFSVPSVMKQVVDYNRQTSLKQHKRRQSKNTQ